MIEVYTIPTAILEVHKNPDGSVGDVILFAVNSLLAKNAQSMFLEEDSDKKFEGVPYYENMSKEPKFEEMAYRCAWLKQRIHTYVDTTMMYGYWTEDILLPVTAPEEKPDDVSYCMFMYTLNKEMDTGKVSNVNPEISSFVIKTCLNLRNEEDFYAKMDVITRDISEKEMEVFFCVLEKMEENLKKGDERLK